MRERNKWLDVYQRDSQSIKKLNQIDWDDKNDDFFKSFINKNSAIFYGKLDVGYSNFNEISLDILIKLISPIIKYKNEDKKVHVMIGHDGSNKKVKELVLKMANSAKSHDLYPILVYENKGIIKPLFNHAVKKTEAYYSFYISKFENNIFSLEIKNKFNEYPGEEVLKYLSVDFEKNKLTEYDGRDRQFWTIKHEVISEEYLQSLFNTFSAKSNTQKLTNVLLSASDVESRYFASKVVGRMDLPYKWSKKTTSFNPVSRFFLSLFRKEDVIVKIKKNAAQVDLFVKNGFFYQKISLIEVILIVLDEYLTNRKNIAFFQETSNVEFIEDIIKRLNLTIINKTTKGYRSMEYASYDIEKEVILNSHFSKNTDIFALILIFLEVLNYNKSQNQSFQKFREKIKKMYPYPKYEEKEISSHYSTKKVYRELKEQYELEEPKNDIHSFWNYRFKLKDSWNIENLVLHNSHTNTWKIIKLSNSGQKAKIDPILIKTIRGKK